MKTKSFWVPVSAMGVAAGLLLAIHANSATYLGYFLLAEAALFVLAFLAATLLGGSGRALALGAALGLGFATVSAVLLGEDCEEDSFLCVSAGDVFGFALAAALAFYPGWALGAGAEALRRRGIRRGEQPPR